MVKTEVPPGCRPEFQKRFPRKAGCNEDDNRSSLTGVSPKAAPTPAIPPGLREDAPTPVTPPLADPEGKLAKLVGMPVSAGGRVSPTTPDRKPILDADGKRIIFQRPVTLARWTVVVDREGKIVSVRKIVNPVTDSEEVRKIVEALPK